MSNSSRVSLAIPALLLLGAGRLFALQSDQPPAMPARPGDVVHGRVHRQGDEIYRLAFGTSGMAVVEVSGAPSDCAIQVGSKGFQQSESSPVDWTDGRPGQAVRHTFQVQAGQPGTVWVLLRSRLSGVGTGRWSAVACSNDGPFYTTPDRGAPIAEGPATFEGRAVRPPIAFRLLARIPPAPGDTRVQPKGDNESIDTGDEQVVAEYRKLLPAVLQAERKPWHTRFEFLANAVRSGTGYRVAYKTYCLIDKGPDAGKDYPCFELDTVFEIGALKAAIPDMKARLKR